jgi:hypothetical protein
MKTCFETEIGGMSIVLAQRGKDSFRVTYWKQVKDHLSYAAAAKELGECIMHALAYESRLDNLRKGGR